MIKDVQLMRFERQGGFGMRVIFTLDDDYKDVFEFDEGKESSQVLSMVNQGIPPASLMVWIRDSMNVTVH